MRLGQQFNFSAWIISFAFIYGLSCPGEDSLPDFQRLQAIHEARLDLSRQHKPAGTAHGVYLDFHAAFIPMTGDLEAKTQSQLLTAAKKAGTRILIVTRHGTKGLPLHGFQDGILVITGTETDEGSVLFPETSSDGNSVSGSGLEFLRHVDRPLSRTNDAITGMEICNNRGNPKLIGESFPGPSNQSKLTRRNLVDNLRAFPDEFFAGPAVYQKETLAIWDRSLEAKSLTGIGVNETLSISRSARTDLFKKAAIDPFEVSFRNLVTHILAEDLTEVSIRNALTNGHAFVAHDWLFDPTGFSFGAANNLGVFGMGDTAPMLGTTRVMGITPLPAKLRLLHNGSLIQETTGTNLTFQAKEPGPYRLEAWLTVAGEERPWIFSNPVYLRSPSASEIRLPSPKLSDEVTANKNLVYRDGDEEDLGKHKLDIYSRKGQTNEPVVFFIHGGSWKSGDRSLYAALGNRYSLAGFVTVVPSYRLAPKHAHPAQIEDVAAAFAWTVQHISEYGGDSNRIYVAGHSAGGHLAALLALDESYLAVYHLSTKLVHGVLALSGVYNLTMGESQESVFGKDPEIRRKASPLFHIKAGAPPFLVTFCQWDYFSLPAQARQFHRALQKAGVMSELVFIPRQSHISEIVNVWRDDDPTVMATLKFMK